MQMESQYLVSAKSEDAIDRLFELWEDANDKYDDCSFEGFATDVFEIMESVIKVVYAMEKEDKKEEFTVVGKCATDYDCVLFMIEYTGTEPMIKSSQADPALYLAQLQTLHLQFLLQPRPTHNQQAAGMNKFRFHSDMHL